MCRKGKISESSAGSIASSIIVEAVWWQDFSMHWIRTVWIREAPHSSHFAPPQKGIPFRLGYFSVMGNGKKKHNDRKPGKYGGWETICISLLGYGMPMMIVHRDYNAVTPYRDFIKSCGTFNKRREFLWTFHNRPCCGPKWSKVKINLSVCLIN